MADVDDAVAAAAEQARLIAERLVHENEPVQQYPLGTGAEPLYQGGHGFGGHDDEGNDLLAGANNKRKYDDDEQGGGDEQHPVRKKSSFSNGPDPSLNGAGAHDGAGYQQQAAAAASGGDSVEIPTSMVGKLIGKGGETIRQLQHNTQTRVQIDHLSQGDTKRVTVSGNSQEQVEAAKKEILAIIATDDDRSGDSMGEVECPQGIVGRIIGRGGETIRALQQASQANIVVDQNYPEGHPRKVVIRGRDDAVQRAIKMVTELINGEPGSAQAIIQKYGAGITRVVDCPKGMVGRVIGKGGETIKTLQKQFGANIQIDQTSDPMKITIAGQPQAVAQAQAAVDDIIAGGNPFGTTPGGSYGGGGGGYGGGGGGSAGGGYAQQQQYPAGGAGYGGYGMPQGYGGFPGYGGGFPAYPQAAAAGGYGAYGAYGADPYAAGGYGAGGYGGQGSGQAQGGGGGGGGGSVWQELQDGEGRNYYYNSQTGVSQWEKPADF